MIPFISPLDSTVRELLDYVSRSEDYNEANLEDWGIKETLIHLVCWHEKYVQILQNLLNNKKPDLSSETFKEINKKAVQENIKYETNQLEIRFLTAQKELADLINNHDVKNIKIRFKKGTKARTIQNAIERIDAHIRNHSANLGKPS